MYVKIVQTGGILERYEYTKKPNNHKISVIGKKRPRNKRGYRTAASIRRSTRQIRLLILGAITHFNDIQPYLLTFTTASVLPPQKAQQYMGHTLNQLATLKARISPTAEQGLSVEATNNHRAISVGLPRTFEYVSIAEYQKRGAVHYHVLIFDNNSTIYETEKQTRKIQNIWGLGYVDCVKTFGDIKLANYLAKYFSKGLKDERYYGRRLYNCSRGIQRSCSFTSEGTVDYLQSELIDNNKDCEIIYERQYQTEFYGRCNYQVMSVKPIKK